MPITTESFNGETLHLIMLEPTWERGIQIEHRQETFLDEGLSGRESRSEASGTMRLTETCRYILEASEADSLRVHLSSLGEDRVAIPIWPDALVRNPVENIRIYQGEVVVNYNENGQAIHFNNALPSPLPYTKIVPLLIGRLRERPSIEALTDDKCLVTLSVFEEGPWAYRLTPRDPGVGTDWPTTLEPNWSKVLDLSRDGLRYADIGKGRVMAVEGAEVATRWGQEVEFLLETRIMTRNLISFFHHKRGRKGTFNMPLWFQPGADTASTPFNTKVRFASDTLVVNYMSDAVARCEVRFWQLPSEISPLAGEVAEQPGQAFLYTFTYELPTQQISRYTAYESSLTGPGGTHTSQLIEHGDFRKSMILEREEVEITAHIFTGNPLLLFLPFGLEKPLKVKIEEADPLDAVNANTIFTGEVIGARVNGKSVIAKAVAFGGALDRMIPRFLIQPTCNYIVFDEACGLNKSSFKETSTISTVDGSKITIQTVAQGNDYYAGGWIETGAGANFETRPILSNLGTQFEILKPLKNATVGQSIDFYPGCDGQPSTCKTKFSNLVNFGGHPFVPQQNPTHKAMDRQSDARKK